MGVVRAYNEVQSSNDDLKQLKKIHLEFDTIYQQAVRVAENLRWNRRTLELQQYKCIETT